MREDLLHLMLMLHPDDAATLATGGRGRSHASLVEQLPWGHEYAAVVPSVVRGGRAVFALAGGRLLCAQEFGEGFVLDLADVRHVHVETVGRFRPRPSRLDLHLPDRVVELSLAALHPSSAGFFARTVERAVEEARRPRTSW